MKKIIVILWLGAMALPGYLSAQTAPLPPGYQPAPAIPQPPGYLPAQPAPPPSLRVPQTQSLISSRELTRFDLNFPGGAPLELVQAIEKASQKPLNVIIPEEYQNQYFNFQIPALKMRAVTMPELFKAITLSSSKTVALATGTFISGRSESTQYQIGKESYGFMTDDSPPRENSIWVFYRSGPAAPPAHKAKWDCRFYQLAPYLETYKVEDITTAIETGWKMLGTEPLPKVSFHKDTKLLIAVGEPEQLEMIDSVLQQLATQGPQTARFGRAGFGSASPAPDKSREPAKP